jgi:hypothetical protein
MVAPFKLFEVTRVSNGIYTGRLARPGKSVRSPMSKARTGDESSSVRCGLKDRQSQLWTKSRF